MRFKKAKATIGLVLGRGHNRVIGSCRSPIVRLEMDPRGLQSNPTSHS